MSLVKRLRASICDTFDEVGALVLSEFTGAAHQMTDAWMVNPYDIDGLKRTIVDAATASPAEASRRMTALRHSVFEHDVLRWAREFLTALDRAGRQ